MTTGYLRDLEQLSILFCMYCVHQSPQTLKCYIPIYHVCVLYSIIHTTVDCLLSKNSFSNLLIIIVVINQSITCLVGKSGYLLILELYY